MDLKMQVCGRERQTNISWTITTSLKIVAY